MHNTIAALALVGQNVIVDHVINDKKHLVECLELLSTYPVTFVKVHCPIEELERREQERGDRPVGLAKSQMESVHANREYDLTVDTSKFNSQECALQIKRGQIITPSGSFVHMKNSLSSV